MWYRYRYFLPVTQYRPFLFTEPPLCLFSRPSYRRVFRRPEKICGVANRSRMQCVAQLRGALCRRCVGMRAVLSLPNSGRVNDTGTDKAMNSHCGGFSSLSAPSFPACRESGGFSCLSTAAPAADGDSGGVVHEAKAEMFRLQVEGEEAYLKYRMTDRYRQRRQEVGCLSCRSGSGFSDSRYR